MGTPARVPGAPALSPEEITAKFLQIGRRLLLEINQFSAFEEPALAVRLDSPEGVGNTATNHGIVTSGWSNMSISAGRSFVFVSGLGGVEILETLL